MKFSKVSTFKLLILSIQITFFPVYTATVVRGPYLQLGTSKSVVIKWRTNLATDSRVNYGLSQNTLNSATSDTTTLTDHEVALNGLSPFTKYFYSVGSSTDILAGGDSAHFFVTAPTIGTVQPIRIWAIGDAGTATLGQEEVRDAYYAHIGQNHTDVWLQLGDNAYNSGTDAEYQNAVFNVYQKLLKKTVTWSTRGNHEMSASTYYDIFTLPTAGESGGLPSGSEAYYSFDYGNIHFVCLESHTMAGDSSGAMHQWLKMDLEANLRKWIVAFWHHPPYSWGSHNSDTEGKLIQMRKYVLPILERHGVDLVLAGHSHAYERSMLVKNHYGDASSFSIALHAVDSGDGKLDGNGIYYKNPGPYDGAVYIVAGSSGSVFGTLLNHPVMIASLSQLGSVVIDVNGSQMDVAFLNHKGVKSDYFSILKGPPPPDSTPPYFTQLNPAGPVSTTTVVLVAQTNENSSVRWSLKDEAFSLMPGTFTAPSS